MLQTHCWALQKTPTGLRRWSGRRGVAPQAGSLAALLALLACLAVTTEAADAATSDGLFLVSVDEGELKSENGGPVAPGEPNSTYISMPHVLLTGSIPEGMAAPPGEMEEWQCAAACRAASGCNVFFHCPDPAGCATDLLNASQTDRLPHRHCALRQQPGALPDSAQPPKASKKGADSVSLTSGQLLAAAPTQELPGYELTLAVGWFNMYDYHCNGSINSAVCMRRGSLQDAAEQCNADGPKCLGIKWFPLGRDFLGPNIFMLKGVPDRPTPQNLPGVPINISLANWNGDVQFYAKTLTAAELAEATSAMTWLQPSSDSGSSSGLSVGAIAGIAVGAAAGAILAAAGLLFVMRRKRQQPVLDAEAAMRAMKDGEHPGSLSSSEVTSMAQTSSPTQGKRSSTTHSSSSGVTKSSTSAYSYGTDTSCHSKELLAHELGKQWLVDMSQIKFVVDKDGNPVKLGAGAQGVVYKALLNGCEPVAVKVVAVEGGSAAAFLHEARMLHGLRHRCVVQLAGVALHGNKAMLIMEYMEGRDLFSALNLRDKSGERLLGWYKRGKRIALDVASALAFLHGRKCMHFDVKAGNVMLSREFTAKLGDVGLSKAMTHTFASKQGGVGTFAWCAPEVLQGQPCTYSADVYSFGVLLFEIVTGEVPLRGRLAMPQVPEQCPQAVVDLMLRCMQQDPAQRPTASQLVEELSALMGHKLAGDGLLSGEDGLDRTMSAPQDSPGGGERQPAKPTSPAHATRLAGVDAGPPPILPPSPFA